MDGFQFDDECLFDYEVCLKVTDDFAVVCDGDWMLLFDGESGLGEFYSQGVFVDFFEESFAELVVDAVGAADDLFGECVDGVIAHILVPFS